MKKILNIVAPALILFVSFIIITEVKAQTSFESWVSANGSREGTVAAVGESIGYSWWSNGAVSAASTYTADSPDNCPGGIINQGEVKPWIASTLYGSGSATVQECQAWHTYTINYTVKNSANSELTKSLAVKTFPRCEGQIYTDGNASQACASLAQQIGGSLGYSISCSSVPSCSPVPDPATGLNCYYTALCNVNGNSGQGAEKLAGYAGFSGNISNGNKSFLNWPSQTSGWNSSFMPPVSSPTTPTTPTTPTIPVVVSAGNTIASQSAYVSGLINVVNDMIQKYKNMIANTNSLATNTNVNITTTGLNTSSATVTVNADVLNVRSASNTQASILGKLNAGDSFTAACYVTGESVEGSSKWWKTSSGGYIWAGGTVGQPSGANLLCGLTTTSAYNVSDVRMQQIISQANVLLYSSLTSDEKGALFAYLSVHPSALIDQPFQTFAPGSVFAWALSMGTSTTLNAAAKSLGFTTYNPVAGVFVKTPGYIIQ